MNNNKKTRFMAVVLLFIVGFAIYCNSFNNKFLWDDNVQIHDNNIIRSLKNIPSIFKYDLTYFARGEKGTFFRPVQSISYMTDYFLWGLNPLGYHITNTLLHILVAVLLFFIVLRILSNFTISLIISLLYLVHPVHTEAVTYISGRADSLCTIFLLLMIILQNRYWVSNTKYKKTIYYLLMLVSFLLGLLSKELSMIFPLLMMFHEYCLRDKKQYTKFINKRIIFYIPFFMLMSVWFLYKNKIAITQAMVELMPSLANRFIQMPKLICDYITLSLIPINLHMEHRIPFPKSLFQKGYFEPFVFFVLFAYLFYWIWKKGGKDTSYRIMFFGIGWFVIGLLPYLHILFVLNASFAEHWVYISEMGFILFVIYALFYYARHSEMIKKILLYFFMAVTVAYASFTIRQNTVWKDSITFYTYTLKYAPYSERIYNNLGYDYFLQGNFSKAKELFEKALKIAPDYDDALKNLQRMQQ